MLNILRKIFLPPVFPEDDEKTRIASYLNAILLAAFFLLVILKFISSTPDTTLVNFLINPISLLVVAILGLIVFMHLGYVKSSSLVLAVAAWFALLSQARGSSGILDTAFLGLVVVVLLAGLLLDYRASIVFAGLTIAAGWWLAYLQTEGILVHSVDKPYSLARDFTVLFILVAVLSYVSVSGLRNALERSRNNEKQLANNNQELKTLQDELEKRVAERTEELQMVNEKSQDRANQLRTIAEISRTFTSLQNLDELLPEIVQRISNAFGFYHVGVFLIDAADEYAVLRAANSEGGQKMLERGHRLKVGQTGIVGYTCGTGRPRIALDVGNDAIYFDNPDLPNTRSEMALPLRASGKTIGALDVQSIARSAFSSEDIDTLSLLADQISISIQNAQLFAETRLALAEAQSIYRQSAKTSWNEIARRGTYGFRYNKGNIEALKGQPVDLSPATTSKPGKKAPAANPSSINPEVLSIPIGVRGEILGSLTIRQPGRSLTWGESEIRLYQSIVDRLSFALENARLIEETTNRAERDRTITDISDKLSASARTETILRTAAEELSRVIQGSEVLVQLVPGALKDTSQ
jgi:GAF domain-containing protein